MDMYVNGPLSAKSALLSKERGLIDNGRSFLNASGYEKLSEEIIGVIRRERLTHIEAEELLEYTKESIKYRNV